MTRRSRTGVTRLYVVSDFHASDVAWKKMLNVIRLGTYKADVVLYAGDLTGKAIVPITARDDGDFEADLLGVRRVARSEEELTRLEADIAALGFYAHRTTADEARALDRDPATLAELFRTNIRRRVADWLSLASERLEGLGVPVFVIPGNDDPYDIDDVLAGSDAVENVDGRVADIPGGLQVLGLGKSSPTPWRTPRELPDDAFRQEIATLTDEIRDPSRTIFLIHCPPHNSGLDVAPLLDSDLRPRASAGDLLRGPVGSVGVREAIESTQPILGLHGHIHESGGETKIGSTLCLNPGSEAAFGILRGYLVDVGSQGIERAFRVEG
jgi:uncharacterized protein